MRVPRPRLRRASAKEAGTRPAPAPQQSAGQPPATPEPAAARPPTVEERLDGLRGWLAQLDRRLGVRTYLAAAALVLALAAAGVGLALVLQLRDDAATEDDLQALSEQLTGIEAAATEAAEEDVQSLSDRLDDLDQQISKLQSEGSATDREISVLQDDVQDLRDQISELEESRTGGGGASSP